MRFKSVFRSMFFVAMCSALPPSVAAEQWPTRPITIVVPFSAGGVTDIVTRMLSKSLESSLKNPVIVENIAGASGSIGARNVARSEPDGYTILMGTPSTLAANQELRSDLPYDIKRDFSPIATVVTLDNVLLVRKSLGVSNVAQLVDLLKEKPGKLSFGINGIGANGHLTTELFKARTDTDAIAVPYKGAAQMLTDLVAGETDFTIDQATSAMSFIQSGQLAVLAVASKNRSPYFPDVPTLMEAGVPDFDSSSWLGLAAPRATPEKVVQRLNEEVNKALRDDEFRKSLEQFSATPAGGSPEDMRTLMQAETDKVRFIMKFANIPVQ